jgi:hypothetical protein
MRVGRLWVLCTPQSLRSGFLNYAKIANNANIAKPLNYNLRVVLLVFSSIMKAAMLPS